MQYSEERRLHNAIDLIGMRAQATAVGLVQLTIELKRAGALDDEAVERIKQAIANEITLNRPRSMSAEEFDRDLHARLDRIFSGDERVGELPAQPEEGA